MRVLVISGAFPPMQAGEAPHTLYLSQHLASHGLDVHVLTTIGAAEKPSYPFKLYPVMRHWSWAELPRLVRFAKRVQPDVVLLIYLGVLYNNHPMITFAPSLFKALLPGISFVTQFENISGALLYRCSLLTRLLRKAGVKMWLRGKVVNYEFGTLLCESDRIIVLSDSHREKLAKHDPLVNNKQVLIPPPPLMYVGPEDNGTSRKRGREVLKIGENDFVILYFGYIYYGKGIESLLSALRIISSRERKNVRLVIVGGTLTERFIFGRRSYSEEMSALAKQLEVEDKVVWTGACAPDDGTASTYFRAADICVLPFDAGVYLNNSSFAAAAVHGLPVVTTKGPLLESPFVHQENVLLCPPRSPEALADAIEMLMDNPGLRQHLRRGVLRLAEEWFSWKRATERTVSTLLGAEQQSTDPVCRSRENVEVHRN